MTKGRRLLAAAAACTLLLGGCSSDGGAGDAAEEVERRAEDLADVGPGPVGRYVALGDSFTAAPLVPNTELAAGCFRSDGNYPSLLAEQLDVERLVDVSCSGATTGDLTRRQPTIQSAGVPPQLRAVSPDTELVTLGIGGNDFDLFQTLVSTCTQPGPDGATGSPCESALRARGVDLVADTARIGARVARVVELIRDRAPDARVLVVGYLRIAPEEGRCPDLPFAAGDYAFGRRVAEALDAALQRAARRTGVDYVDMHAASEGHDVCAEEPWVNGQRTVEGRALAFHPFAEGMQAVADEVVATLSR